MVVTIKLDMKCAALYGACLFVAVGVLMFAFPGLREFLPKKSDHLAAWIQAIGSIGAIAIAGYAVNKQIRFSKNQTHEERLKTESNILFACVEAAYEVNLVVENTTYFLLNGNFNSEEEYLTKIQSLSELVKVLFSMPPHAKAIAPLLVLINQLDNTKLAINEYSRRKANRTLGYIDYKINSELNAKERSEKTAKALQDLSLAYRSHN